MPRYSFIARAQACLVLAALMGCGGADEKAPTAAAAVSIAPPSGAAPVAQSTAIALLEDHQFRAVLAASDADGDALAFSITIPPAHATVTLAERSGEFQLQPDADFFGDDTFEFEVLDGNGNSGRAHVNVRVEPINDAPVIDTRATATVVPAGHDVQLNVGIADADNDRVTMSVSLGNGSMPIANLESTPQGVRFRAPDVRTATTVELVLSARDDTGLATRTSLFVTVSPLSPSEKLFTVLGSPDSSGLHWVITGDGFTATQQQELLRAALDMARALTGAPELARHAAVWNVHVLTIASRDSGVARDGAARAPSTAFDGSLYCTRVERVACVNWDKVYAALLAEHAPFDAVAVILNTDVYIGNSSSSGLLVSRNGYAPAVALHEMGHLVAGLADEYTDESVERAFAPRYDEGQFPNVTTVTEPSLIPWRHWFVDPAHIPIDPSAPGVGRFEGAYYAARGFYRPKRDSFMRTVAGPIGEVNAEAWLRAQYRAVPPLRAAYPLNRHVAGVAGAALAFEVVSTWSSEIMAVRWFVDGTEIESARDAWHYVLQADGRLHEVRAWLGDRTGRIRAPNATEHNGGVTWTVSGDPSMVAAPKLAPEPVRVGAWIRMRVDAAGHAVIGVSQADARGPHHLGGVADAGYEYSLFDAGGTMLSQGRFADPRIVHGPMAAPGSPRSGHGVAMLESGYYLIEVPEGVDARRLRIRALDRSTEKMATERTVDGPESIGQWLDL
jgi:hypothetical protein